MFKIEVIGNLGSSAEIKNESGNKFVSFSVAHTDRWTSTDGQKTEETTWVDCIMNNVDSAVIPFLKAGTKVFVRGYGRLRIFSSAKERRMKAGVTCVVQEVELCGGQNDSVPRELIIPDSGAIVTTQKYYWVPVDTKLMKKEDLGVLLDTKGNEYTYNKAGFVSPKLVHGDPDANVEDGK